MPKPKYTKINKIKLNKLQKKNSAQLLNINTIVKNNLNLNNNIAKSNSDIAFINNIFNNSFQKQGIESQDQTQDQSQDQTQDQSQYQIQEQQNTNKYNIVKYLGEGIQGSLYLANDNNNKRYICKKIMINTNNETENAQQNAQINFELNILKYLSSNNVTKEYINPCLEHKIVNNQIFTIFPVFDGYSLNHLMKYLSKLDHASYYKIVFHLIKTILHGMAKIHQHNIAHQNLNNNSILVSTYKDPNEISIKFTDFGLGCGNSNSISNSDGNGNDIFFNVNTCKDKNMSPVNIDESYIRKLSQSNYLIISQKYDVLCLGMLFLKLLLFFEKMDFNPNNGYNTKIEKQKSYIINKYFSKDKEQSKKLLSFLNVKQSVKHDILEYLKIIIKYILCKTSERQNCQYILDKIIIYEKYKNDVF